MVAVGLALMPVDVTLADGPGMLLYTSPPAGSEVSRTPFRAYRAIGRAPQSSTAILPLIGEDGRVRVLAPDTSPLRVVPGAITDPVEVVYTPLGFCMARGASGALWAWGQTPPAWMPEEPMMAIDAGINAVGGIALDGSLRIWNREGPLEVTGKLAAAESLSLGSGWGATISTDGDLELFAFGSTTAVPPLSSSGPLVAISVDGGPTTARAAVIDAKGSLRSLVGAIKAPGVFEKAVVSSSRLVALEVSGQARVWNWNAGTLGWDLGLPMHGVFADVGVAATRSFVILDRDANRDGIDDPAQALAGEIPDVNGDLLDDRTQPPSVLLDEDANGVVDRVESPGVGERRMGNGGGLWFFNAAGTVVWAATARVPGDAETLRRITLRHMSSSWGTAQYNIPAEGLPAEFALWVDPNGDGDPIDVVLGAVYPITLSPSGRTVIDLGEVALGPPGTVIFQSLSFAQPVGRTYPLFLADTVTLPAGFVDPLRDSRFRGRSWGAAWAGSSAPALRMDRMRFVGSFEQLGLVGSRVPVCSAVWGDRFPGDCDGSGGLDSRELAGFFWGPGDDLNQNGIVDGCEQDCDGDGQYDVSAILAGATDCDRDMTPDGCVAPGEADCDGDGTADPCQHGWSEDCNGDGVPDACQVVDPAFDADGNGVLDACELDCDGDGTVDRAAIAANPALDCDKTGFLDACELIDCNSNGVHDPCELLEPGNDCNGDGILDACQSLADCNADGVPDACDAEFDCDSDGVPDVCEIAGGAADADGDAVPDDCEYARGDLDLSGTVDALDLAELLAAWGSGGDSPADLDGSGTVDALDLASLLASWGPTGL